MGSSFSLILLGILGIFGVVFYFINKNRNSTTSTNNNSSKASKSSSSSDEKKQDIKKEDVFKFMEFDKIQDDMIVQNNGQKYTMAIKCKGINYDLMSDVEQMAVEEGFITFLNTLKYPIQLYVQAQNIDLKGAINTYKENISPIKEEFDNVDLEYTRVTEAFESTQDEIEEAAKKRDEVLNVYEYANDIISYVERMSMNKNLLQRSFYVLVSYHTSEINATEKFSKEELDNICYSELFTRAQAIISALAACSVEGKVLDSNELADLLYTAYNRDDRGLMNVKEAIESGFYRLYSTSKDAFTKRNDMLKKEIEDNAKIKAYQAIVDSINNGTYESPRMEALKVEEDTSRLANELIKRENIPEEVKEKAQKKVVDEYRETKQQVLQVVNREKNELYERATRELGSKVNEPRRIEQDNNVDKTKAETIPNMGETSNNVRTSNINNENNTTISNINSHPDTSAAKQQNASTNASVRPNISASTSATTHPNVNMSKSNSASTNSGVNTNVNTYSNVSTNTGVNPGASVTTHPNANMGTSTSANSGVNANVNTHSNGSTNTSVNPGANVSTHQNINTSANTHPNVNINAGSNVNTHSNISQNANTSIASNNVVNGNIVKENNVVNVPNNEVKKEEIKTDVTSSENDSIV